MSNSMHNANRFKLGLFGPNCSGGMSVTKVPERWDGTWESNARLARIADEAGIEFILSVARWLGYGGDTNFHGHSLDPIGYCNAMAGVTSRTTVFATVHTAFTHPLVAAKQFATAENISGGRFGINVVCGFNQPEYEMFGATLPKEHSVRYGYGEEWLQIILRAWRENQAFDYKGKYFDLAHVMSEPKPLHGMPPIMNAAASDEGRAFAVRNVDFLFTLLFDVEKDAATVKKVVEAGRAEGRNVQVFTTTHCVCRPTTKEAQEYYDYYAGEMEDADGVERLMELQGLHAKSFPPETFTMFRKRFAGGHGTYPVVGSPDDVADELERIANAGFAGCTLSFVDYAGELEYFAAEVLPRLERKGLRLPQTA